MFEQKPRGIITIHLNYRKQYGTHSLQLAYHFFNHLTKIVRRKDLNTTCKLAPAVGGPGSADAIADAKRKMKKR